MRNSRGSHEVFAYGSLMNPKFVEELLGKSVKLVPAKLEGYKKVQTPGRKYPAAVKHPTSSIKGELLLNLSSEDVKKIDKWEETPENLYVRIKAPVMTKDGVRKAFVYITKKEKIKQSS
ncbi:hypothetical protein AKJ36_00160 [candidate division MSBL1 archaeon SCGC-AAA259I07]|uniref:Putative gamma-glutamylcyclotransferase n=1 Tax=candidate division MSBL1 archaeon SCGC-AAA259I07 TaxID=1698266 RepID=A0A133UN60_9EURY|nr:hypothetical protein AKJ36_00160 [candidate division MSBL1 archaeon SCGC-AAA259I07]